MHYMKLILLFVLLSASIGCAPGTPLIVPAPPPTRAAPSVAPVSAKSGTIRYFHNPNVDMRDLTTLMALDDLRAQGYTVVDEPLAGSSLLIAALEKGDADLISGNNQNAWLAIAKGIQARTIMQRIGMPLVIAAKQELKTCADLNGKPLGLSTSTGLVTSLYEHYMKQNCPDAKPEILSISEDTGRVAGLVGGQLDAAQLPSQYLVDLEKQAPGRFHTLIPLTARFPQIQINGLHARREWAEQNPATVRDVIRALLQANRRVIADPQLLYDEAVKRMQLEPAIAKQVGDLYLQANVWDPNGAMTETSVQATLDFMQESQLVPAELKVQDVTDLSYLNAVLDEIGRK